MPTHLETKSLIRGRLHFAKEALMLALSAVMSPHPACRTPVTVNNLAACSPRIDPHKADCIVVCMHCACGTNLLHIPKRDLGKQIAAFAPGPPEVIA